MPSPKSQAAGLSSDGPAETVLQIREAIIAGRSTVASEIAARHARIDASQERLAAFRTIAAPPWQSADPTLPLAGVCIGVKDLYDTAGMPTGYGSPIFKDHAPEHDAALVCRLRALGAHIAGKTVTTEFAWRQAGPTVNPWNPAHTPGGSSSGSAAAVAAGLVPLATGTQTFGSVIRPAAFCGVVGFKPTYGLLPLDGVQPLSPTLDHPGLFAQTVDDISYVFGLLVQNGKAVGPSSRPPRLRVIKGPFWAEMNSTQHQAIADAGRLFAAHGATIVEQELPPEFDEAFTFAETILCAEAAGIYAPLAQAHPDLVSAHIKALVDRGRSIDRTTLDAAFAARDRLRERFASEMAACDAVLTPPALGEAPLLEQGTGNAGPCIVWTLLGAPAIALPYTRGAGNLPVGLQLVGACGEDERLLSVAAWSARLIADTTGAAHPKP